MNPSKASCFRRQRTSSVMQKFDRRAGTSDMTGELFEVNGASVLFIRGMFETNGFHLATNVDQAGAFDDLVFKFKDKITNLEYTCFLQLKTKLERVIKYKDLIACTGDFSLLKYYASYCDIQEEFSIQTDCVIFGGIFENCEFIIYTNTKLESDDSWYEIPASGSPENILYCGGNCGKIFCLKVGSKEDDAAYKVLKSYKNLLEDILVGNYTVVEIRKKLDEFRQIHLCYELLKVHKNEDVFTQLLNDQIRKLGNRAKWEQFLKKLKVYTNQAIEGDLEAVVKQDLETCCGISDTRTQEMFIKLKNGMIDWWRKEDYYLTESYAPFWCSIMEEHISGLVSPMCNKMAAVADLRFQETQNVFCRVQVTHLVAHGTTKLSCLKLQQNLVGVGYIMVDSRTLQDRMNEVLLLWRKGIWYNILIIEGETDNRHVITGVADVLRSYPDKQLIVVAHDSNNMTSALSQMFTYEKYNDTFSLNQLDDKSQETLLDCKVNLQHFPVNLKSLADLELLQGIVTADIAVELLAGELKIGEELLHQDEYYVSRTILRGEGVDKEVLSLKGHDCFAVSGTSVQELQKLVSPGESAMKLDNFSQFEHEKCCYYVIDSAADFTILCDKHKKCVHWLHKQGDSFLWKHSKENISLIKDHLTEIVTSRNLKEIVDLPEQVVLVVAEPGMGKSTELSHVGAELKGIDPATWVVRVDLNSHTDSLSCDQFSAMDMLVKAGGFSNDFQKALFEHAVYSHGNVVVMIDGFDEISPKYENKVLLMLRNLRDTKIKKLWVTSRPVMGDTLERHLLSLHFELKPFSPDNQKEYFLKYWKLRTDSPYNINMFVSKLLKLTEMCLNDKLSTFAGIPLQTRMLAEALQAEARHYSETGEIRLPHKLDILQLYNRFVQRKWEIYCSEKDKVDITKVGVSTVYDDQRETFQKNHMKCALVALLDVDGVNQLHNSKSVLKKSKKFLGKFKTGVDKVGIIIDVVNGIALFIHRTFAEYFVGVYFARKFESHQKYLHEIFLNPGFQIARNFFDRILAQNCDLHVAVMNLDKVSVEALVSKPDLDIDKRDEGGRTALYLAVMCYVDTQDDGPKSVIQEIIGILLKHDADPNIDDKVLCWRPLCLAVKIKAWAAVESLLGKKVDSSDLDLIRQKVNDDEFLNDLLKVAIRQGFVQLLGFLLDCGLNVEYVMQGTREGTMILEATRCGQMKVIELLVQRNADIEAKDNNSMTPLSWAADKGHINIVKYLIEKGARVQTADDDGNTALMMSAYSGHSDVFDLLSQYDINMAACGTFGSNALHFAAMSGNIDLTKHILNVSKLDIDCHNAQNCTPLWYATLAHRLQVVQYLCEKGANVNIHRYSDEYTPLHLAASGGNLQIVECLASFDASITALTCDGYTPLHLAVKSGHLEVVQYLRERGAIVTTRDVIGCTPLHTAAENSWYYVVEYLLECGASVGAVDNNQRTLLHAAAAGDNPNIIKRLVERGADVSLCDSEGDTALDIAARNCRMNIYMSEISVYLSS